MRLENIWETLEWFSRYFEYPTTYRLNTTDMFTSIRLDYAKQYKMLH